MQEYAPLEWQAEKKPSPRPRKRMKIRYTNKTKVLLCYGIAWALALAVPLAGLVWVYPYKLVGTAPAVAQNLTTALPFLAPVLQTQLEATALLDTMTPQAVASAMQARDAEWRTFVGGCFAACWLVSLILQLAWRWLFHHPLGVAKATRRAIRAYRMTMLLIGLVNALGGLLVYLLGVQFIGGRTVWDWLLYMGGFGLNGLAAFLCFRLAAPPTLSGKHSFFKRL